MPARTERRKLSPRDHLRLAHSIESAQRFEHEHGMLRLLTEDQQQEATARQRITDGIQQQQNQAADLEGLSADMGDLSIELQDMQNDLTLTRRQLVHLDGMVSHGDTLLRQHVLAVLDPLQQLQQRQQDRSTDLQDQLSTMQRLLIDALAQLGRPKKVTITRNERGKISGATVE